MTPDSVLILGGGLGGFTTAQELRKNGFEGTITIVDPEGVPYDRPPLSKEYLVGKMSAEQMSFVPDNWYADSNVTLVTDAVESIDPDAGSAKLVSGEVLTADILVLAMGGRARTLPIPGGDLPGLSYLRTKADADALRGNFTEGRRIAIIGAGLIGAEVTSTAVKEGMKVTLIDPVPTPLVPVCGAELATLLQKMHAEHGVEVRTAMTSSISHDGNEYTIKLNPGDVPVVVDDVLVAVGLIPNTEIGAAAGLELDNGIIVNEAQLTSHPKVYAVGDLARHRLPDGTLLRRHEHWESAMHAGQAAAAAICGKPLPKHGAGWMWSDRYGVHLEAVGNMADGTPIERVQDGKTVAAFRIDADGHMIGAAAIDGGNTIRAARRIIDRGIVVDQDKLVDPSVDLKKLAK